MGNNVSEWMLENYTDHWKSTFELRQKRLKLQKTDLAPIIEELEKWYNNYCDKDGQLVRGANWADERISNFDGKNRAGINAKTFVSPHKQYSTLGFRYVVIPKF